MSDRELSKDAAETALRRDGDHWVDEGMGQSYNLLDAAIADAMARGEHRVRRPWNADGPEPDPFAFASRPQEPEVGEYVLEVEDAEDTDRMGPEERRAIQRGTSYLRWREGRDGMADGGVRSHRYRRDPKPVSAVLKGLSTNPAWARHLAAAEIGNRWEAIVGPDIARHCTIESFEDGKLVIRSNSTAWMKQLQMLIPQLDRKIEEAVGRGVVEQIQVLGPSARGWGSGRYSAGGRGVRDTFG